MAKSAAQAARTRASQARLSRERIQRRRERVKAARWWIAAWPLLIALFVVIRLAIPSSAVPPNQTGALPQQVSAALVVSPSILDNAGRGKTTGLPTRITGQPALKQGDKPLVLYVGAEYCPFCAAQRWGLVVALNRFGTFSNLSTAYSAHDDVYPDTATVSFHGASYDSQYIVFQGVELATSDRKALDKLTADQEAVFNKYNAPPFTDSAGAVPFIDMGNSFLMVGSTFSPGLLAGLSQEQIAQAITKDPGGQIAQAILGSANAFTAMICTLTGGQPGNVCTSTAAKAYQKEATGA